MNQRNTPGTSIGGTWSRKCRWKAHKGKSPYTCQGFRAHTRNINASHPIYGSVQMMSPHFDFLFIRTQRTISEGISEYIRPSTITNEGICERMKVGSVYRPGALSAEAVARLRPPIRVAETTRMHDLTSLLFIALILSIFLPNKKTLECNQPQAAAPYPRAVPADARCFHPFKISHRPRMLEHGGRAGMNSERQWLCLCMC